jgi:hypothetical protein
VKIETHRIKCHGPSGEWERETCDAEEAQRLFDRMAGAVRDGSVSGRVSWSVNGMLKEHATSPGYVWPAGPRVTIRPPEEARWAPTETARWSAGRTVLLDCGHEMAWEAFGDGARCQECAEVAA